MEKRTDRKTLSYCKYGYNYRKNTDVWTNSSFKPKKCEGKHICAFKKQNGFHALTVQGGGHTGYKEQMPVRSLHDRYRIPPVLVRDIFNGFNV